MILVTNSCMGTESSRHFHINGICPIENMETANLSRLKHYDLHKFAIL